MLVIIRATLSLLLVLMLQSAYAETAADSERLDAVVERGRHVMPFDLEKTLHVFNKNQHGGVQQVIAKDPTDKTQISLIRQHLEELVGRFQKGDFSRQRRIHGNDMPGLAELASDYKRVHFGYRELPDGAEIEYVAEDSALIDAIHRYFNAQLHDHARHAVGGLPQCKHKAHRHHGNNIPPKSTGNQE